MKEQHSSLPGPFQQLLSKEAALEAAAAGARGFPSSAAASPRPGWAEARRDARPALPPGVELRYKRSHRK